MDNEIFPKTTKGVTHGSIADCGEDGTHYDRNDKGNDLFDNSVEMQVDDSHSPDHFLVTIKYGLYYKHEGWKYGSYQLKLSPDGQGNLRYDLVSGATDNLYSSDKRVQGGPIIRYTHAYRLNFFCVASCFHDENGSRRTIQKQVSLCLKVA